MQSYLFDTRIATATLSSNNILYLLLLAARPTSQQAH